MSPGHAWECARGHPTASLRTSRATNKASRQHLKAHSSSTANSKQLQRSVTDEATSILKQAAVTCLASLQILTSLASPLPANAVLNSPNAQIPRSADAALRRSIPAFNANAKDLQRSMEDVAFLLRIPQRKPWGSMSKDVKDAIAMLQNRDRMLEGIPATKLAEGGAVLDTMYTSLKKLELAVAGQQPDMVSIQVAAVLKDVAALELLQAPGLAFALPRDYLGLPRLIGRATVALEIEKADGSLAFVDKVNGGLKTRGTIEMTLDGYSAPVSAGNFVSNILEGLYDNVRVSSSYSAVVVQPKGFTEKPPVPLEILPAGEFDPVYRSRLDVQSGELPVLPLSIYGAVSMAHVSSSESFVSGQDWFMFKYDKQSSGLGGLAFDEGTFGVFGYVTKGADVLESMKSGDVIVSTKVTSGLDKFIAPQQKV